MTQKENILLAIHHKTPEWIPVRKDSICMLRSKYVISRAYNGGKDDWGIEWIATDSFNCSYPASIYPLTAETAETLVPPHTNFEALRNDLKAQVTTARKNGLLAIGYNELTLFERAQLLMGTTGLLEALVLEPDAMEKLFDIITEYQIHYTETIMQSGCDGVRFTDDWGTQSALLISPQMWRRFIKPRLARLYSAVKKSGGLVFQHSCGHIEEIVPDLIELGCDVLDPCQPAANNVPEWKKLYGKSLTFMGGLDTQGYLTFSTPEQVYETVQDFVNIMGADGGYIAAPSHTIDIPPENREAMYRAIHDLNLSLKNRKELNQ